MRLVTAVRVAVAVLAVAAVPSVPASGGAPATGGLGALGRPGDADNGRRAGAVGASGLSVDEPLRERSDAPGMLGIPGIVLDAYRNAALQLGSTDPGCRLTWQMLAGVGKVESDHARGGAVTKRGDAVRPILGPVLDGRRYAAIRDTDDGVLDGDTRWDRAVGPLQFIPSSWQVYASDGNGDGLADPQNVYDAALATARYLCEGGRDLSRRMELATALYSYNHSLPYVRAVLAWIDAYTAGRVRPDGMPDLRALGLSPPAAPVPTGAPTAAPPAPRTGPGASGAEPHPTEPDARGPDPGGPDLAGPDVSDSEDQPPTQARPVDPTTPDEPGHAAGSQAPAPSDVPAPDATSAPGDTSPDGRGDTSSERGERSQPSSSPRPTGRGPTSPKPSPITPTPEPSSPAPAPTCATTSTPTPNPTTPSPSAPTPAPTTPSSTPTATPTATPSPTPTTPSPTPSATSPTPSPTASPTTPVTPSPCARPAGDDAATHRWAVFLEALRLLVAGKPDEVRLDPDQ
ncbi:transglycosylase protein with SLT domain [Thermasporomyces composti]|mgnify:CR=1 FL=1|jgi:hypothetical protein|uniref:Transglycosylase protein with SLT domain n=1 Tax=Thermasporomyces composti TaxID=696763 RepID=A0A3D9VB61_THECX|nr:transglycosylase protein with SLT domain [Thermasporomyces composti]